MKPLSAVNLRRSLALRLLLAMCKEKQFVLLTLNATMTCLENGVS